MHHDRVLQALPMYMYLYLQTMNHYQSGAPWVVTCRYIYTQEKVQREAGLQSHGQIRTSASEYDNLRREPRRGVFLNNRSPPFSARRVIQLAEEGSRPASPGLSPASCILAHTLSLPPLHA
jgi:hypothetical protein